MVWRLQMFLVLLVTVSQTASSQLNLNENVPPQEWGPWTGWSVCSTTCGYGTVYRIRQCHAYYQRYRRHVTCTGQSNQYKLCIVKNCTHGETDYRTAECSKHNNIKYGLIKHTWIPYINSAYPCELSCKSAAFEIFARFQKTVADFVTCNEQNTAMCIQGKCVKTGCDGIMDSGTQLDSCGVCGGNGTTCQVIHGIFTLTHLSHNGYSSITTIPKGAYYINITEMNSSSNHLALSTTSGYFLNGDMHLQPAGDVKGAGTTFTYARSMGQMCPGECITALGPLNAPVTVELIYFGRNPGIRYQFTFPRISSRDITNSATPSQDKAFTSHKLKVRERHHNGADSGKIKPSVIPRIRHGKYPVHLPNAEAKTIQQYKIASSSHETSFKSSSLYQSRHLVTDSNKDVYRSSHYQQSLSSYETPVHADSGEKSHHQAAGTADLRYFNSKHGEIDNPESKDLHRTVNDKFLGTQEIDPIGYKHYYHTTKKDAIGDVPESILQYDSKETKDIIQDNGATWLASHAVSDDRYAELKPTTQNSSPTQSTSYPHSIVPAFQNQQTSDQGSPFINSISRKKYNGFDNMLPGNASLQHLYSWRISGFTVCSEPCGRGVQETRIVCVKADSQVEVLEDNCEQNMKPESTTVVCNNQPCDASWEIGEWNGCSVTCGRGLQKRGVICKQKISPSVTLSILNYTCSEPKPQAMQYCQLDPCFIWQMSNWSKCSSECGFGQQTRTISCVDNAGKNVSDSLCIQNKPSVEEVCDMGSCAQGWFHTKWSQQCSFDCGRSYYTRQVYCSAADGSKLDEMKCSSKEKKPSERKICRDTKPCGGQWFSGPWAQCNSTCGTDAYRHRDVFCIKRDGKRLSQIVKEKNCFIEEKPPHTDSCGPFPACNPHWFVMSWAECSKSCGAGVKIREVKCMDASFVPSPDCDKENKPSPREPCNTHPCIEQFTVLSQPTNEAIQMDWSISAKAHPACKDTQSSHWCQMAKQARLCYYPHFRKTCCHTCNRKLDHNLV